MEEMICRGGMMSALRVEAAVSFGGGGSTPSRSVGAEEPAMAGPNCDALLATDDPIEQRSSRIATGLHIRTDRGLAATGGR